MPASSACSRGSACGSRISGVARCRDYVSTHPRSASRRRVRPRENSFQRWPRRRPSASASNTGESVSEGSALSGARALRAGRSPSTGASCSRHLRCWTKWSCMSCVTCASRTTRDGSGRSSSDIAPTGASNVIGCVTMDPSSWHSARGSDPPDRHLTRHWPATRPHRARDAEGFVGLLAGVHMPGTIVSDDVTVARISDRPVSTSRWRAVVIHA